MSADHTYLESSDSQFFLTHTCYFFLPSSPFWLKVDPEAPVVFDAEWAEGFSLAFSLVKTYAPLWASSVCSGQYPVGTPPTMSRTEKKADAASADKKQTDKKIPTRTRTWLPGESEYSEDDGAQADELSSEKASLSTGSSWDQVDSMNVECCSVSAALGMTDASVSAVAEIR